MEIINDSNIAARWWCYNSDDQFKGEPLSKGDVSANGGKALYNPPSNATGRYFVKFTEQREARKGNLGGSEVEAKGSITLTGTKSPYQVMAAGPGYQPG